ncbi:MAG TPA: hypothetical protein VF283_13920 [Bryobacteraceae bacterium]
MTAKFPALLAGFSVFAFAAAGRAATDAGGPEDFRIEIMGSAWIVDSSGTIQSGTTPVDIVSDLGAEQRQPAFFGSIAFKPTPRQEIVVEGMPLSIQGRNTVQRSVMYHGQTFFVNQTLHSSASLNYLFAGYQYDFLSGRAGDLGVSAGGAYLSATGTIHAIEAGTSATKSETLGLPLAGVAFRLFPIPGRRWIEVEGGMRGMSFGGYGSYLQAEASGGIGFGPIAFLAGYREIHADLHSTGTAGSGVNLRLRGPIFSMQWCW